MNADLCSGEKEGPDQAVRYNYSIVVSSDISNEAVVKEMVDVCQIACEKHAAAEKSPSERNNMAAANMIKGREGGKEPYCVTKGIFYRVVPLVG